MSANGAITALHTASLWRSRPKSAASQPPATAGNTIIRATVMSIRKYILALPLLLAPFVAHAQGTLPVALQQQFSFTNCATFTNACGTPLSGGLLYFYQVGTVATPQDSFQDTGLTLKNPWPLTLDANGRIPNFYLANGSVHVRLTDGAGVVQFDVLSALVIGPSSGGGGGGGGSVDPTTIAGTGDIKFRPTSEFLTGWVKLNGETIGSAVSGASGRANADTQSLFVYLWANCPDAHCPVVGGRGGSGLADFNANKQLTLLDMRGRAFAGLDDMGNIAAGRILSGNVTSGGGDGPTTPQASGGEANHTLTLAQAPPGQFTFNFNDPGHNHAPLNGGNFVTSPNHTAIISGSNIGVWSQGDATTAANTTGISASITDHAGGQSHNVMNPFMLGTWYQKL